MSAAARSHTVFLVPSASHATKGEAVLLKAEIPCRLIPVPRTLSSQCGVCLRVRLSDRQSAQRVLDAAAVEISAVHDLSTRPPGKEAADGHSRFEP